jgi:hypothetical protein
MQVLCSRLAGNRVGRAVATAGIVFLTGCYTYAETSIETLAPGIQTRVQLDADGFGRVVNQAAINGVPVENLDLGGRGISGRLMSLDATTMMVEMRGVGGSVFAADIPMHAVQGVAVRTFSTKRTILAVGLGAVLGGLVYSGTVGGTTGPNPPDEPEQMTFPVFTFSFR